MQPARLAAVTLFFAAAAAAGASDPTAPALAPGFHVADAHVKLPGQCRRASVRGRLVAFLEAFDSGRGDAAAASFARRSLFVPYDGTTLAPRGGVTSRPAIAGVVRKRYAAGDGWSARALLPPLGGSGLPHDAVYTVTLEVLVGGRLFAPRSAKVVVQCGSGLIRNWVGPRVPAS
jgi:hypothetical protein